jgi:hypothetical protein
MPPRSAKDAGALPGRFPHLGTTLEVERLTRTWRLKVNGATCETRDLSAGIEQLFGKRRQNLALAVRVMEWDDMHRP